MKASNSPNSAATDAEYLRGDLCVEPFAHGGYKPSDQPDQEKHEADDRCDDGNEEQPDRDVIDDAAQHVSTVRAPSLE